MRTKALLLAAAFAAAGVATSMAQVYSVNAVGYVNVTLKRGFNLVANPLDAGAGNTMGNLAKNIQGQTFAPDGSRIFKFRNDLNRFVDAIADAGEWLPANVASETIVPGEGFFFFNPNAADLTLTFVGEVKQGTALANPLPRGFSIKSNIVPQEGTVQAFGMPAQDADRYFKYDATAQRYFDWIFDAGEWVGSAGALPPLKVGEAFLLFRGTSAGTWTRSFNVNTGQ